MTYSTATLLQALVIIHEPGDFLLSTLVTGVDYSATDTVDIDIERRGKKMAPFVSPVREGVVVENEGYETKTHKVPYIHIKTKHSAQEALSRRAGQTQFQAETAAQFISKEIGKDLGKLDEMIFRREEWMLAKGIQTGKVPVEGKGLEYVIDFGMKATHLPVLGAGSRWDETTADINGDLVKAGDLIFEDSGRNAGIAIMGRLATRSFMKNPTYGAALDRRRIDRGEIKPENMAKGVKYFGYDRESGFDLYGYTESFYDETTSDFVDLIEPENVVFCGMGARVEQHYGAIQNVRANFVGPRFPHNWIQEDPSIHWVSLDSAPLVAPHEIDAFVCMRVLA